ncbi:MAG: 3-phosphoshikimate 1-carboxyvinyltransferase [Acidobacteria bacterium 13_1_20CM_3_53_8]|nr:MAG: 3-phosphoshikimate 1-carboxyvinyltransferase [Acidobacteria bacterium 13_1_20CM_3_53_8]
MIIRPARRIRGQMSVPGDKSISHRAAIMAALAEGDSRLYNFSTSADCASTLECLRRLGVTVERDGNVCHVQGVGRTGLRPSAEPLDCGNSGSTMRMLAGVLAGQDFVSELTGDESLNSRPMRRVIEPLELMGAQVSSVDGRAPLRIKGRRPLKAISYAMPVASAQVKSCILLAGLNAKGRTEVLEPPLSTRDHTERMLRYYGASVQQKQVERDGRTLVSVSVDGLARLRDRGGMIPGDISSAAFFIVAAALLPQSKLKIVNVGLNITRTASLFSTLTSLGAGLRINPAGSSSVAEDFYEPIGAIDVSGGAGLAPAEEGRSNVLGGALIPQLIDELPMLAVLGTQVLGGFTIKDASELRVKESDRITATVENLRAMGADVEEHEDGLTIKRRTQLHGAKLNSYGDHRIAMAFTVAALIAEGESYLAGADCVKVSFPEFFQTFRSVIER